MCSDGEMIQVRPFYNLEQVMAATLIHAHAVVIGASRGIGLGLTKGLHEANPGKGEVVATMRVPNHTLLPQDVRVEQLDITDAASVERFASKFEAIVSSIVTTKSRLVRGAQLILFALPGAFDCQCRSWRFYLDPGGRRVDDAMVLRIERDRRSANHQSTRSCAPQGHHKKAGVHLQYRRKLRSHAQHIARHAWRLRMSFVLKVAKFQHLTVSLLTQSVSKAAGNMVATQFYLALRNDKIAVGLLHPGWVATDMGKGAGDGGMPIETSVDGLIKTIDALTFETSPWFADWQGKAMPW